MTEHATPGTVGFIGLGTMGCHMARNLLKAGHAVHAYDVRPEAVAEISGAVPAASIAEAARAADIVITMLPDTPDVEAVVLGPGGLADNPPPGGIVADMSTISPQAARRMHGLLAGRGVELIDAPVSGGPVGALNGTLTIMAGGSAAAFARARSFFAAMGTTVTHVGGPGAGQTVKLCNQVMVAINIQSCCEALALARASGVDLAQMREVLMGGSAASWMLDRLGPAMISGDASAGFRIDLMLKDLRLVAEMAQSLAVPLPGTALVTSQYVAARAHGEGGNGNQALFRVYDRMTNQVRD
ncbi:NAD(P)-dependent oxidoreductase [Limobrevibacterium gyesilva]|uniref:NAD(P)-dependent oxidoreductase n=1 Tax=Limobrevibacterium gyesilva TaxID=2991712 RepID=A0AA41YS28_9PROT|nr:NAD(P)-dependent oxidoreductase [Limobrevibacterium gyesilva]MCW3475553.1 NAD(P)-dependent oxidoreductase [Limobrevibacterium gyesilva]